MKLSSSSLKATIVAFTLAVASMAYAETLEWCGPSGGAMTNAENWVVSGTEIHQQPTMTDTIVFNPGEGSVLTVNVEAATKDEKTLHNVSVLSGDVVLCGDVFDVKGASKPYLYLAANVTNVLHVAEGSSLLIRTIFGAYTANKCWLEKTGAGSVKHQYDDGSEKAGSSLYLTETHIIEGSFTDTFRGFRSRRFVIESGASFTYSTYSCFTGFEAIEIKKGGTFSASALNSGRTPAGITGEGDYKMIYASTYQYLLPTLYQGPYRFAGTIRWSQDTYHNRFGFDNYGANTTYKATDEMRHFIICGSNTLDFVSCFRPSIRPEWGRDVHEYWTAPILGKAGVPIWTEDEDGKPIRLHANFVNDKNWGYGDATTVFEGCGEWWPRSGTTTITGNQVRVTGKVGVPSGVTLKIGNGTDAAADVTDYPFAITNEGTVVFQNVEDHTMATPFRGAGALSVIGPVTLADARLKSVTFDEPAGTTLTLTGSSRITAGSIPLDNGGHLTLDGPRVLASGTWTTDVNEDNPYHSKIRGPGMAVVNVTTDDSLLTVRNGATFYFGRTSNFIIPNMLIEDGGSYTVYSATRHRGVSDTNVRTITLNGGSIDLTSQYSGVFASSSYTDTMKILIGEKGGAIRSTSSKTGRFVSSDNITLNVAVEDVSPVGADGGTFCIDCGMPITPSKTWSLKGSVVLADAFLKVNKSFYDLFEDGKLFSPGDLVMESGAWMGFGQTTDAITPRVAWGEGRKLRVNGAARINISAVVDTSWKDRTGDLALTVGPSGAAESSLVVEPGAALTFWNDAAMAGMPSTFHVRVNGGVPCHADGRTKAPLFFQGGSYVDFLTYDENLGLTNFNNYVNSFVEGTDSTVLVNAADRFTLVPGETQVGAVKIVMNENNTKNVKIPAGATLKVGNGTDPAILLFRPTVNNKTCVPFDGAGSIDFGTSKGVLFYPRKNNARYIKPVQLKTRLTGQNGVNYLGMNNSDSGDDGQPNTSFSVEVANDYEGDTVIDMASVMVTDKDAFSSGDVVVKGSRLLGGAVVFGCEGPFANNFTISKFGRRLTMATGSNSYYPSSLGWGTLSCGALEFTVAGTRITGDVHVVGRSRISSYYPENGSEVAIFEGVVSGDTLEIVDSLPNDYTGGTNLLEGRRHKFVFCNDNTITGGVEVLNGATAVLRGANPSFGSGMVTLSGEAVLRFENTAELDFTNKLFGAGTIQLGATKEVLINGDVSEFEGVIDLCGLRHEFSKVPPFACTNTTGHAMLAFKGGLGTVDASALELTGEAKGYDLAIGAGTLLDLGGKTLIVRRFADSGSRDRIVNGEVIEADPKRGAVMLLW